MTLRKKCLPGTNYGRRCREERDHYYVTIAQKMEIHLTLRFIKSKKNMLRDSLDDTICSSGATLDFIMEDLEEM